MRYRVVPACCEHIPALAARMRAADRREVMASHGLGPLEALRGSLERSTMAWTLLIDDVPAGMAGVCPAGETPGPAGETPGLTGETPGLTGETPGPAGETPGLTGRPWLLATPDMERVPAVFLARLSRLYAADMLRRFSRLENRVHAGNRLSIRWLRWCGFTIADVPERINGEDFFPFWRDAHV